MADEDKIEARKDGSFLVIIDGKKHVLRRPKIGQLQELEELWDVEVVPIDGAYREQMESSDGTDETKAVVKEAKRAADHAVLDWHRKAFELLEANGLTLSESDGDLPAFMLQRGLYRELRQHWYSVPWGPGGSPTQVEATKPESQLAQLQALLSVATAAQSNA